jgi:hypothetical protein
MGSDELVQAAATRASGTLCRFLRQIRWTATRINAGRREVECGESPSQSAAKSRLMVVIGSTLSGMGWKVLRSFLAPLR